MREASKNGRPHSTPFRRSVAAAGAATRAGPQAARRSARPELHSPARRQPTEQSATMKVQLLLRRVDPLGAGSDEPAERAHEPAIVAVVDGAFDLVAQSATIATTAAARSVFHRSSAAAATAAAV